MKKILIIIIAAFIFGSCSNSDGDADMERKDEVIEENDELITSEDGKVGDADIQVDAESILKSKMVNYICEPEGIIPTEQQITELVEIIQKRLDAYIEPAKIKEDETRIMIRIPDTEEAKERLLKVLAIGDFRIEDEDKNIIITNEHVMKAVAQKTDYTGMISYNVDMTFTEEGRLLFKEATEQNINKKLDIYIDDKLMVSATVIQAITDGRCTLTAINSMEEAEYLAAVIRYGRLPFKLTLSD